MTRLAARPGYVATTTHKRLDTLDSPQALTLLRGHPDSSPTTAAESRHALNLGGLPRSDVTFWCAWDDPVLAGFDALRQPDPRHGEIKSMRIASIHLRRGVASRMLQHLIGEAVARGYAHLSLETGSMAFRAGAPPVRIARLHALRAVRPLSPDQNGTFMTPLIGANVS